MRSNRLIYSLIAAATVAALLQGCNTSGCTDNQSSIPLAGFYSATDGAAVTLDSLAIYGIGAPGDSLLLAPTEAAHLVYLPLRVDQADTRYVFRYHLGEASDPALNDTLTFVYTSAPYFVSEECGASYRFQIQAFEYTRHLIDSISLLDTEVTNIDRERLKIYFHVSDDEPAEE